MAASYDEVTQIVNPNANPESVARRIRGAIWRITDRSETGCRLTAPAKEAPGKLGELLAIKEGDLWMLAVVRRMQRLQVDEVTVGVEIIARRIVRVLMRSWVDAVRPGPHQWRSGRSSASTCRRIRTTGSRRSAA